MPTNLHCRWCDRGHFLCCHLMATWLSFFLNSGRWKRFSKACPWIDVARGFLAIATYADRRFRLLRSWPLTASECSLFISKRTYGIKELLTLSNIQVRKQALDPKWIESLPNSKRVLRASYCKQDRGSVALGHLHSWSKFSPGRIGLLQGTALCSHSIAKDTQKEYIYIYTWNREI